MNYDFDTVISRSNTNSIKYDFITENGKPKDILPLWVADMDFPAPPEVLADIQKAVVHGIFGYTEVKDAYYAALCNWFASRFGYSFTHKDVVKSPGVVFALAQVVRAFTDVGDGVLIQTPVYHPFFDVIRSNKRKLVTSPLLYADGNYQIDFIDFERKIQEEKVKLFLLCSPHNPVGRVWTRQELEQLNTICKTHGVCVVADEIHCDFVYPGRRHTCFGTLNEDAVIATAPSKTFNLAGLQASNLIVKNLDLRRKLQEEFRKAGYSQLNTLGLVACQSAYTHGGAWLAQLLRYLAENCRITQEFMAKYLPKIRLVQPQGTYLLWLDFSAYGLSQPDLDHRVAAGAKLWLNSGTLFGPEGKGFQRMNIACPRATLLEALDRLLKEFK